MVSGLDQTFPEVELEQRQHRHVEGQQHYLRPDFLKIAVIWGSSARHSSRMPAVWPIIGADMRRILARVEVWFEWGNHTC